MTQAYMIYVERRNTIVSVPASIVFVLQMSFDQHLQSGRKKPAEWLSAPKMNLDSEIVSWNVRNAACSSR